MANRAVLQHYYLHLLFLNQSDICISQDAESTEPALKKSRLDPDEEDDELDLLTCKKLGSVFRTGRDRLVSMATDDKETTLICHVCIM